MLTRTLYNTLRAVSKFASFGILGESELIVVLQK